jgi:hypothetical protein
MLCGALPASIRGGGGANCLTHFAMWLLLGRLAASAKPLTAAHMLQRNHFDLPCVLASEC